MELLLSAGVTVRYEKNNSGGTVSGAERNKYFLQNFIDYKNKIL